MDHGWRSEKDGDRMKKAISTIYQNDSTESCKRRISTIWTGFVLRRHKQVAPEPFRLENQSRQGRGNIMHRRYRWGRLGAILEAGVWVARKSRIILGHFRALEPLLHVEYDG